MVNYAAVSSQGRIMVPESGLAGAPQPGDVMTGAHYARRGHMASSACTSICSPGRSASSRSVEIMTAHMLRMMVALLLVGFWLRVDRLTRGRPASAWTVRERDGCVPDQPHWQISVYETLPGPSRTSHPGDHGVHRRAGRGRCAWWVCIAMLTLAALYWTARQCLMTATHHARNRWAGCGGGAGRCAEAIVLAHLPRRTQPLFTLLFAALLLRGLRGNRRLFVLSEPAGRHVTTTPPR